MLNALAHLPKSGERGGAFAEFAKRFLAGEFWARVPTYYGGTEFDSGLAAGWLGWAWCLAQLQLSGCIEIDTPTLDVLHRRLSSTSRVRHSSDSYFYGPYAEPLVLSILAQVDSSAFDGLLRASMKKLQRHAPPRYDDVFLGTAGSALGLFQIWRRAPSRVPPSLVRLVCRRLEQVMRALMRQQAPSLGLAHGITGVLLAAEAAYQMRALANLTAFREWVFSVVERSATQASARARPVWPRTVGEAPLRYAGWCNGPTGMVLAFSLCFRLTRDRQYARLIDRGLAMLTRRPVSVLCPRSSLCCGKLGLSEAYLGVFRARGDAGLLRAARQIHRRIDGKAYQREEGANEHVFSLHRGLLGLVYLWFELQAPDRLPAVGFDLLEPSGD